MKIEKSEVLAANQSEEWLTYESGRCLNCYDPPCQSNCPANIPIPTFINSIRSGNLKHAAKIIYQANPMAAICGQVCPEEIFCQSQCTRAQIDSPVNIRELHSYAAKHIADTTVNQIRQQYMVAIIGAGPAGLSCASVLSESGIEVDIFEQLDTPGGVPSSSIPEFRLSDKIINLDINRLKINGVKIILNKNIAKPDKLLADYRAIFIAAGLSESKETNISEEKIPQVLDALTFLEDARKSRVSILNGKTVVIIGGGNVSLDVAATAIEIGAGTVHLLYRRGPNEMKVWKSELEEAQKRGVIIDYLAAPNDYIVESGDLKAVNCSRMRLTENIDSSNRFVSVPIEGADFIIPADYVIEAIGMVSDYCKDISVNPNFTTSVEGIFAGGDWARGEGTIVEAVRDGKLAAEKILSYLKEKIL